MTSLYIHIPFCKKKCNYCDFVSYAGKEDLIDEYVDALIAEINTLTRTLQTPTPLPEGEGRLTTYFGGGTPTLLKPRHFKKIMVSLPLSLWERGIEGVRAFENTVESNPGTADKAKLKELRKLGINRLSIGAQSFNDKHLRTLGRIHNSQDIFRIYDDARSAGFDNINLDLIFALPGQALDEWKKDVRTAIDLGPNHLSTYNLQIEEGTPLYSQLTTHNLLLTDENTELAMYEYTIQTLKANGYKHYEISNFAKSGFECKHNINYWKNGNYIGIGAGAHSHIDGKRWANPNCLNEYLKTPSSFLPLDKGENVERSETRGGETIFMGLRLLKGLSVDNFQGFEKELTELVDSGLLMRENSHVKLTRNGLYLANEVFERFV